MSPSRVLFVCVHNAGRSQMAAAFIDHLSRGQVEAVSGGTAPIERIHPQVLLAMRERGIELEGKVPRRFRDADIRAADVVVTMGCGDECPFVPGRRYEDWEVDDPSGKGPDEVRGIRDDIEARVRDLLRRLPHEPGR